MMWLKSLEVKLNHSLLYIISLPSILLKSQFKCSQVLIIWFCRVVSVEQGKALADKWGAKYVDASAKENQVACHVINDVM